MYIHIVCVTCIHIYACMSVCLRVHRYDYVYVCTGTLMFECILTAACCNILQLATTHNATQSNTPQRTATHRNTHVQSSTTALSASSTALQYAATYCNTTQHTLQHKPHHTVSCRITPQQTATHHNTCSIASAAAISASSLPFNAVAAAL